MSTIEDLEAKRGEAAKALRDMERRKASRLSELTAEARDRIAARLVTEFPEDEALRAAADAAQRALEDAKIAEGIAYLAADPRAGKTLVEWTTSPGNRWSDQMKAWRYPWQKCVLQVRTRDIVFASNMGNYRIPAFGEIFGRLLKKDGTPGTKIERHIDHNWLPEGEDHPNAAPKEHRK